ncbi:hypothetical protein [Metabacillus halosaccharovorans]|uniref:hypothetical protein n=1 Tax=Metabacillus halosaccharovorans TaxID=930124 RepID=UPI001C1FB9E1|nr:hypothetical protein [Metabacillus halosaccharovorans]MBU7592850.1 hypothetical protein [Metabacillus halosaccharovorans]
MKTYIGLKLAFLLMIHPIIAGAEIEGYEIVSRNDKENMTLYAKKMNGLFRDFKINFKGGLYSRPFWLSETSPTYAPQIIYEDINKDQNKELIIILTKGYGTDVLWEDVYVFDTLNNRLNVNEVIVDNPLAIIHKNVKTKLTAKKAEVIVGDKKCTVDITPLEIKLENLFDDIGFGSIIDYEVRDNQLIVSVAGQISPASFVGNIVIVYEYRDKMYQAKLIEFQPCK